VGTKSFRAHGTEPNPVNPVILSELLEVARGKRGLGSPSCGGDKLLFLNLNFIVITIQNGMVVILVLTLFQN
jgi:hypothetical protein